MSGRTKASLLGEPAQVAVERALSEFRSGRPVLIASAGDAITALPVDGMTRSGHHLDHVLGAPAEPTRVGAARRMPIEPILRVPRR
jgi:hypothetical protein